MALYTIVDDGYDVDVCKSFAALWNYIQGSAHRSTDSDTPLYLGSGDTVPLTKAALRQALAEIGGTAWVYEEDADDWTLKIQAH